MAGLITELECAMPECACPCGRAYFADRDNGRSPWNTSADRYPVPKRDGGRYDLTNVRLSHSHCNYSEGGRFGGRRGGPTSGAQTDLDALWAAHARWRETPAAAEHFERRRSGWLARKQDPEWQAVFRERARRTNEGWGRTPAAREAHLRNTPTLVVGNCRRWKVDRGKPCVCGRHEVSMVAA